MKLAQVLALVTPFLATDKKPEDVRAAILAADKKARDAAGSGLGARELEEKDQAKAQDAREHALDEREEAMDAAEEKADKDKSAEDKEAKDRKHARDARKGARDTRKGARDKRAKDRNDDPEHTNDEDYSDGDPSTPGGNRAGGKTAVDSAEVDRRIAAAVKQTREDSNALHEARSAVEPILGKCALDSAEAVYRAALDKLGVDNKDVPAAGLPAMLKLAKDKAAASAAAPSLGLDSAGASEMAKHIKGYDRLK